MNFGLKAPVTSSEGAKKERQPNNRSHAGGGHNCLFRYGVPVFFFSCFFVFLLVYIDPAAVYSANGIDIHSFVTMIHSKDVSEKQTISYAGSSFRRQFILELTPTYAREIAGTPGGWTQLAITLCIYACHYPFIGAFAVTGLAIFFYGIFLSYLKGIGARRTFLLGFIPPFFIMTVCAWYEFRYCAFLLPVAGALACAVCYQHLRRTTFITRALWLSLIFWCAWYFIQWGGLLVLVFIVIHELFSRKRGTALVIATAAVHGALFYIVNWRLIPLGMTVRWNDFAELSGLPIAVIGIFPLVAIVLPTFSRLRHVPQAKLAASGAIVRTCLLLCGTLAAIVWLCREPSNRDTRTIARTIGHVMNGQWEAVLKEKTGALFADFPQMAGPLQAFMIHAEDHALCRTGQIGNRLFSFPQAGSLADQLLILGSMHSTWYLNWVLALEQAMYLGMINTAEKIAGEIMEIVGPYPEIMYRRSLVQIAKGNTDAAAVFLNKLACMPFYRAEARRLLGMLDNSDSLNAEPRIASMRANMDTADYFLGPVNDETVLCNLLKSNPGNKAAYDYLMTYYVQTRLLERMADLAPKSPAFGYTELPRCWEEALCVYLVASPQTPTNEASFSKLRQETLQRFSEFAQANMQMGNGPAAAAKLAPSFGNSFFYYTIFKHSAGIRND